jgi:DNA-binding PadR family transcriptional regulator
MTFVEKLLPKGGLLRYAILSILQERPLHGYEIIKTVETRTKGLWRPSPGSVYPTLSELVADGFLEKKQDDNKEVYSLTIKGQEELKSLEKREGKLLDAATRLGEITTGLVVGGYSLLDITFKNINNSFERTLKTIDEKTSKERLELLQAYRSLLQKQLEMIDTRIEKANKTSTEK